MHQVCSESGGLRGNIGLEVTGILGVGSIGSSGNIGTIEDLVSGEIVNLVSHTRVEVGNSINEHLDDLIEELVFLITSSLFGSPSFTLSVKIINGVVKGIG